MGVQPVYLVLGLISPVDVGSNSMTPRDAV